MPCRDCTDPSLCVAVCQAFKAGQPAAARRCWDHPGYDAVDCPACSVNYGVDPVEWQPLRASPDGVEVPRG
jgi:hypothetical protein